MGFVQRHNLQHTTQCRTHRRGYCRGTDSTSEDGHRTETQSTVHDTVPYSSTRILQRYRQHEWGWASYRDTIYSTRHSAVLIDEDTAEVQAARVRMGFIQRHDLQHTTQCRNHRRGYCRGTGSTSEDGLRTETQSTAHDTVPYSSTRILPRYRQHEWGWASYRDTIYSTRHSAILIDEYTVDDIWLWATMSNFAAVYAMLRYGLFLRNVLHKLEKYAMRCVIMLRCTA